MAAGNWRHSSGYERMKETADVPGAPGFCFFMKNLTMYCPLVDGSSLPFDFANGREMIRACLSDDLRPPPRCWILQARTDDGLTCPAKALHRKGD